MLGEADIPFATRYLIDRGLTGGVSAPQTIVDYHDVTPAEVDAPARICILDIECEDERGFPDPQRDAITCITCHDSFDNDYTTFLFAPGGPPAEISEPFTVMLWGVTTDTVSEWLKAGEVEAKDLNQLKGFASSAGIAEGPARVLKLLEDIVKLQPGEILVAPCTNPSWAPVFTKIKGAVTDIGGLTSHAAIVSREYGLPAVTGTGVATSVIKTGDIVRLDGSTGMVTIVKRAKA